MDNINAAVGNRLRNFRKMRCLTLEDVSSRIGKSRSTISKYEKGEITIDIQTLYELASVYRVHPEQLLVPTETPASFEREREIPAFFLGLHQFFGYLFDGRSNALIRCVFDVRSDPETQRRHIMLYMNCDSIEYYQKCENTYSGYMDHYDALTTVSLVNAETPMEKASLQILAPYLDAERKWALWTGFSSRPMMPVATKMLLTKVSLPETPELMRELKISKEDIRLMKLYNMFSVT